MTNERTGPIYTANGKHLLRDTGNGPQHFADFSQAAAAQAVATLLKCDEVLHARGWAEAELHHMEKVLWA
jgi:hypothetical protein